MFPKAWKTNRGFTSVFLHWLCLRNKCFPTVALLLIICMQVTMKKLTC